MKYYSLKKILKKNATYNIIFGERSNGKTYASLQYVLENYFNKGEQFVYVRRWSEDIKPKRMSNLFNSHLDLLEQLSGGKYTGIYYRVGVFYLCTFDEHGKPIYNDNDILGFAFSLSETEHNKANSYPKVTTIIFDEFLTSNYYLPDEFILFMNTISTVVRNRTNVKIFMLGNTVNKFCPYFSEMGLTNILKQKQGTIDVYNYGESKLTVAVEYADNTKRFKKNNYYFAFDNPKLKMITGGAWELNIYPHAPVKFKPKDILYTYFIDFSDQLYQCEIVNVQNNIFTYIHIKTTDIKNKNDLIYSLDYKPSMYYNRSILNPQNEIEKKITWFFVHDRVYYQDNDVGDAIQNYLKVCRRS